MAWSGSSSSWGGSGANAQWGGESWSGGSWGSDASTKAAAKNQGSWGGAATKNQGSTWGGEASGNWSGQSQNHAAATQPASGAQPAATDGSWGASADAWGQSWKRPNAAGDSWSQEPAWKKQATAEANWNAKGGDAQTWGQGSDQGPIFQAKVDKMRKEFASSETVTNTSIEVATKTLENEQASAPALKSALDSLADKLQKVKGMQDSLINDCSEARKATMQSVAARQAVKGPAAELEELLAKAKGLTQKLTVLQAKLTAKQTQMQKDAEMKAKEAKDAATFKPMLGKISRDVATVEESVNRVSQRATPVIAKAPEGEELTKMVFSVETAAAEASRKVEAAKTDVNEKLKLAQTFAPETKKLALEALAELSQKLTDSGKQVKVYLAFKSELPRLIEGRKTVDEVTEKLAGHDPLIAEAMKMGDRSDLTKEDVTTIDETVGPVQKAITEANTLIDQNMKSSDPHSQAKLMELKANGEQLKQKLNAVAAKIKPQKDVFVAEDAVIAAKEKIAKAEETLKACQDAELPFLTGVEVLDDEEGSAVLKECDEAGAAANQAVSAAKIWISKRLVECKKYTKELCDKTTEDLTPLQKKILTIEEKLTKFKNEMASRRTAAIMVGALEATDSLEKKVKTMEAETKLLKLESLEDESVESIKAAVEKAKAVLNEASASMVEAKKVLASKMREAKALVADPAVAKISSRVDAASTKVGALRTSLSTAEKIIKIKDALTSGEGNVKELEDEIAKVQKVLPAEGEAFGPDIVASLEALFATAGRTIKSVTGQVQSVLGGATPISKLALQKLLDRRNEAQRAIEKMKADTKDARGVALCDSFVKEAEAHTKATEAAGANLDEAEKPFLTGEELTLKARQDALKASEDGLAELKKVMDAARKHADSKTIEIKPFGEALVSKLKTSFFAMAERRKKASDKMPAFEKELRERAMATKLLELQVAIDELEIAVKKNIELAAPFLKDGAEKMSEEEAEKPLKAFMDADKETSQKIGVAKASLTARQREQKGKSEELELLKVLNNRLCKAQDELTRVKKITAPHEQRALLKQLLAEAAPYLERPKALVEAVEEAASAADKACSPIASLTGSDLEAFGTPASLSDAVHKFAATATEKAAEAKESIKEQTKATTEANPQTGGTGEAQKQLKLLFKRVETALRKNTKTVATVNSQCKALVELKIESTFDAVRNHAAKKSLSAQALFDSLKKDAEVIKEEEFCKFLSSLEGSPPTAEVAKLISQKLVSDDGISSETFLMHTVVYYKVLKGIAFTDIFEITKCKPLRKAEEDEILQLLEGPVKDERNGMVRVKCKALADPPCEGWITLSGNQGTVFMEKTTKP